MIEKSRRIKVTSLKALSRYSRTHFSKRRLLEFCAKTWRTRSPIISSCSRFALRSSHVSVCSTWSTRCQTLSTACLSEVNERVGTLLDSTLQADEDVAENVSYLILVCCGRMAKTYVRCMQLEFISETTPKDIGELVVIRIPSWVWTGGGLKSSTLTLLSHRTPTLYRYYFTGSTVFEVRTARQVLFWE